MSDARSVMSPCMNICAIDELTGYCMGCQRTRTEIENWMRYSDIEKLKILDELDQRLGSISRLD